MFGVVQIQAKAPRNGKILRIATSGAVQKIDLSASSPIMSGYGQLGITVITSECQYYFAPDNSGTIALDSTTAGQMGFTHPVGQFRILDVNDQDKFLILISRAAGFIDLYRVGQERTGQR